MAKKARTIKQVLLDGTNEAGHLRLAIKDCQQLGELMKQKGLTAHIRIDIEISIEQQGSEIWHGIGNVNWQGKI